MGQIHWAADVHVDHAADDALHALIAHLLHSGCQRLLLAGDLSNASRVAADLVAFANRGVAVDFVLGNHDHFGSSVGTVRDAVIELGKRHPAIRWLPPAGVVALDDETVLVGVDGWADGRFGKPLSTPLRLNDDRLIIELRDQPTRLGKLAIRRVLADADARRLDKLLRRACERSRRIVALTHVPPFAEVLPTSGRMSNPDWLPLLICGATGTVLHDIAAQHPQHQFLVLAGHTHVDADVHVAANLRCIVAGARYGAPATRPFDFATPGADR